MELTPVKSRINFYSFIWHGAFLALASNFMDVDTIIPSMLIKSGGTSFHLGLLTAIMLGGSSLFQLVFASFLSGKSRKKGFLLLGINLRVLSLFFMSVLFFYFANIGQSAWILFFIFLIISVFSFSGSFANVSYVDILGKSILPEYRKRFFSLRQIINSVGILFSALIVRQLLKRIVYPDNFALLFLIAGILLLFASLGFWRIEEVITKELLHRRFLEFFRSIPGEIRKNRNLGFYLLIINSLGLGMSILPFFILMAKNRFGLSYSYIGNILLFRISGMLLASLILFRLARKFEYKQLLKISLILGGLLPVIAIIVSNDPVFYQFIFIFSGVFVTMYKISINGILIEISTNENRALYTGISGAGNILTTLFPLLAGFLIGKFDFTFVFLFVAAVVVSSYFFVGKLNCKKDSSI